VILFSRQRFRWIETYTDKKKLRGRSSISLDGGDLATFGSSWREGVPAIVEANIYQTV
jgi:hypothetical protein